MWGWLQERRKVGSYDYAGCLSLPRVMYISGNRLHQVPKRSSPALRSARSLICILLASVSVRECSGKALGALLLPVMEHQAQSS